jgi:hemoglobin-like flavoprotein
LKSTLTQLGARHVGYGVTDEMYDWVGESLLLALEEVAGSRWTDEMATAWAAAFGFIAFTMKEGARLARARKAAA